MNSRKFESPGAKMTYWAAKGATCVKEYSEAYSMLKELRNHSLESFSMNDQKDIQLSLIQLHNRFEEYVEAVLLSGYLYTKGDLATKQKQMLELEGLSGS